MRGPPLRGTLVWERSSPEWGEIGGGGTLRLGRGWKIRAWFGGHPQEKGEGEAWSSGGVQWDIPP